MESGEWIVESGGVESGEWKKKRLEKEVPPIGDYTTESHLDCYFPV